MARKGASQKWVYFFGGGKAEGRGDQKELLGGKGAGLAEMTRIGLPVPGGFTITTEACAAFSNAGQQWPKGLEKEVRAHLARLEKNCKKKLGDPKNPLLVSVRSGAARSMPGMMETILNLGLNDRSVEGLAAVSNNRRFAFDAYRRLIMMYASTAKGVERALFDEAFDELKGTKTRTRLGRGMDEKVLDTDADASELESLVGQFKDIYRAHVGAEFPQDPFEQLRGAIDAVFNSWNADKAVTYRRVENITGLTGTAVNVCQMVFGNMGDDCGTGVCFTRDPSTGEAAFYGDFLINAQGEDVVAGIRTPLPLRELQRVMPEVYQQLEAVRVMLEVHYKDMQDLEFTIERDKLYMLQCRIGKRSPQAAFKIAVDQATSGLLSAAATQKLVKKKYMPRSYAKAAVRPIITRDEAIQRVSASDVERLFYPVIDPALDQSELNKRRLGAGIGAVPGAASGAVVFSAAEAEAKTKDGTKVILVRKETSPEDVGGMYVASGILTATGGKTSHAAVVARGWGKCCIVGCETMYVDYAARQFTLNGRIVREGEYLTLDGGAGTIFDGPIPLVRPQAPDEFETLMQWCDQRRRLRVRTNADTPADAQRAVELGAEGIGLCRTEHMFFDPSEPQRIRFMREMILAETEERRRAALDKLLPFQRKDFEGIFEAMDGLPVTIRLLDPPLHEFLPHHDNPQGQQEIADELNRHIHKQLSDLWPTDHEKREALNKQLLSVEDIQRRVDQLHEANPMLGHRGCRLTITYPEILDMQVRAIIEAALHVAKKGIKVLPEIMIPLSIDPKELGLLIVRTKAVADDIIRTSGVKLNYLVGTMIETPRAALLADQLAAYAEFYSFGTNDLTQMTMGLSRDDAGRFLPDYLEPMGHRFSTGDSEPGASTPIPLPPDLRGPIFTVDPFTTLDVSGVGQLVRMACERGRRARPALKLGICGEHGGDPVSIFFFEEGGLDYVSCSPLRVAIARLAAAQSAIRYGARASGLMTIKSKPKSMVTTRNAGGMVRGRARSTTVGSSVSKKRAKSNSRASRKR